jgi:hypothetical protein
MPWTMKTSKVSIDSESQKTRLELGEPTCKCDVQKLLGKVNYLRRFISNLASKVDSFLPLIRLKHHKDFRWGDEQRRVFEKIKDYLTSPPILRVPRSNGDFRLYIAA